MLGYLIRRIGVMMMTLVAISVLCFIIIKLPPGDYLDSLVAELQARGEAVDQSELEFLRQTYGLDKSGFEQYLQWAGGLLVGDFGYSFEYRLPVSDVIGDRMLLTIVLSIATILFIWVVSFPIAIYSAVRQYSLGDYTLTTIGFLGLATPDFLLGMVLLYLFNVYFGISVGGLMDPIFIDQPWSFDKIVSVLQHLVVPVIVIGTAGTAAMIRRLRANLLDELQRQYYVTAKAKGLPPTRALVKYPLRVSLNPFIADIGNYLPELISSGTIVSVVLSLETTGPMIITALQTQDMYLAGSFLMLLSILTVIGMFLSDLALAALDPRIRVGAGRGR